MSSTINNTPQPNNNGVITPFTPLIDYDTESTTPGDKPFNRPGNLNRFV